MEENEFDILQKFNCSLVSSSFVAHSKSYIDWINYVFHAENLQRYLDNVAKRDVFIRKCLKEHLGTYREDNIRDFTDLYSSNSQKINLHYLKLILTLNMKLKWFWVTLWLLLVIQLDQRSDGWFCIYCTGLIYKNWFSMKLKPILGKINTQVFKTNLVFIHLMLSLVSNWGTQHFPPHWFHIKPLRMKILIHIMFLKIQLLSLMHRKFIVMKGIGKNPSNLISLDGSMKIVNIKQIKVIYLSQKVLDLVLDNL